jgi:hypothetical protein
MRSRDNFLRWHGRERERSKPRSWELGKVSIARYIYESSTGLNRVGGFPPPAAQSVRVGLIWLQRSMKPELGSPHTDLRLR